MTSGAGPSSTSFLLHRRDAGPPLFFYPTKSMANIHYKRYAPRGEAKALLTEIAGIVRTYAAQGLRLTLRQLYYQLVSRDRIPNEEKSYKKIGTIVSRARQGGLLDWDAIEDRVRTPQVPPEFDDLEQLVNAAINSYRLPRLRGQMTYVELWVEKDALAGILAPIARRYHIVLMVNRGYSSTSAMKESAERIASAHDKYGCQSAHILYLGDLDPSGEDMVRDIEERLNMYCNTGQVVDVDAILRGEEDFASYEFGTPYSVTVEKLALTMEQVDEYDPPPNPAKLSDSRSPAFVERYGHSSWEVDALPPTILRDLIEERLSELIDDGLVAPIREQEEKDKALLLETARRNKLVD